MSRETLAPLLGIALLSLSAPAFSQDIQFECEVWRFSERSHVFVEGRAGPAEELRKKGELRYQVQLPLRLAQRTMVSSTRRIPLPRDGRFTDISDSLVVKANPPSQGELKGTLSFSLDLHEEVRKPEPKIASKAPVRGLHSTHTTLDLEYGRDVILIQTLSDPDRKQIQVVILRVVRTTTTKGGIPPGGTPPKKESAPPPKKEPR